MARSRKHPIEFRREEVSFIMQRWRASESCSLVGVGSVGKSNLLLHLEDSEVQSYYMENTNTEKFRTIIIDPNMLGPLPSSGAEVDQIRCWAAYELMMHRLFMSFYPFDLLEREEAKQFYEMYQTLQDGTNPLYAYMGLRYFELGLEFFMRHDIRIVFMFDEFEEFLRQMPVKFFQTLRGLRDSHKSQLTYLTFTRSPLPVLISHYNIPALEIEPFAELFTDNVCFVGPYNEVDAIRMVEELMYRNQKTYARQEIEFLLQATGRYAGLIRAAFRVLDTLNLNDYRFQMGEDQLLDTLASKPTVRTECRTIWTSLSSQEQTILRATARLTSGFTKTPDTEQAVTSLVQKRLLRVDKLTHRLQIEPPVFRAFILSDSQSVSTP